MRKSLFRDNIAAMDELISAFMRANGKKGGIARKAKYSPEELKAWGAKGGRPKKGV